MKTMRSRVLVLVGLLVLGPAARSGAQQCPGNGAFYHGTITVKPAKGRMNPKTGVATLTVRNWPFEIATGSNGLDFTTDGVILQLDRAPYEVAGAELKASKRGTTWTYRSRQRKQTSGVRMLRIRKGPAGYTISAKLLGLDFAQLVTNDPVCFPFGFESGDDDFFSGIRATRKTFATPRLAVPTSCDTRWPDWCR